MYCLPLNYTRSTGYTVYAFTVTCTFPDKVLVHRSTQKTTHTKYIQMFACIVNSLQWIALLIQYYVLRNFNIHTFPYVPC